MDFGSYLAERGLVTDEQLLCCQVFHRNQLQVRLGRLAISEGKLSPADVTATVQRQKVTGDQFGEAAVKLGLLKPKDLISLLRIQRADAKMLGECIVKLKILDRAVMEDALADYLDMRKSLERNEAQPVSS